MNEYYKRLISIWNMAIENDVVTHELFTEFCRTFFYYGGKKSINLDMYEFIIKNDISKKKCFDSSRLNEEKLFMSQVYTINEPIYKEYAINFVKLYSLKLKGIKPTLEPSSSYSKLREKLGRKYSTLTVPIATIRLSNKNTQELKRVRKWKSSAIDDLANILLELERYENVLCLDQVCNL